MREYTAIWGINAGGESTNQLDSSTLFDGSEGGEAYWSFWLGPPLIWYTPKTDWLSTDVINAEDFNAIETNIKTVRQYLSDIQYAIPAITTVINRDQTYVDYLASVIRIESNLETIRSNFVTPTGYPGTKTWLQGTGFSNEDANRLELDVKLLMDYSELVFDSLRYCGIATCGEQGVIY